MQRGQQRRALAAGGDVGAAEIGDRRDARAFGDHAGSPICSVKGCSPPGDGARSGRASRSRRRRAIDAGLAQQRERGVGEACADRDVERAVVVERNRGVRVASASSACAARRDTARIAPMTSRRGSKRTSAASMPSALVPEIRPR